jgi:hypothetical protein
METPSKRYKHEEIMEMQEQDVNYLAVKKQMESKVRISRFFPPRFNGVIMANDCPNKNVCRK